MFFQMIFLLGVDQPDYFKELPDTIRAAAEKPLGIIALMVIALSVLAYLFFKNAGAKVTVPIFLVLFGGVVAFCTAYTIEAGKTADHHDSSPSPTPSPVPTPTPVTPTATPSPQPTPTPAAATPTGQRSDAGPLPPRVDLTKLAKLECNYPGWGNLELVRDGSLSVGWNSGHQPPPPIWIQFNFDAPVVVERMTLIVDQSPDGETIHNIEVTTSDGRRSIVKTFSGRTVSGMMLDYDADPFIKDVRSIRVETIYTRSSVAWKEITILGYEQSTMAGKDHR
jgi:hypothetical protein